MACVTTSQQACWRQKLSSSWCRDNREAMDRIVESLVEVETMRGDEFRKLLSGYTKIPEVNLQNKEVLEPIAA